MPLLPRALLRGRLQGHRPAAAQTPVQVHEEGYASRRGGSHGGHVLPSGGRGSYDYEDILLNKGIAKRLSLGDSSITTVDEPRAFEVYHDMITKEPDFFIDPSSVHDYDKTFLVKNMVAL